MKNRFMPGVVIAAVLTLPIVALGCSDDAGSNPLCCNEFKVGATVDVNVAGTAKGQVAAQAVADVAGIASAAIDDLTTACRNIAQDLDASTAEQDAAEKETDKNKQMKAWCSLAVKQIGSFKAGVSLTVTTTPAVCEASISAKAECQAKCSGGVECDLKVNPPTCTGGKLEVACKGECTAKAGASLSCEGTCEGTCQGSCTATGGGVQCAGRCDGTCSGSTDSSGNCQGTCKGTCAVTAPGVKCEGSCTGTCSASCKGTAEASVKCDGECKADYEPISCKGGKLEGGCKADVKCDAKCDASVQAKAQCTPPTVDVKLSGGAELEAKIGKLYATLKANLPLIFALRERVEAMVDITGTLSADISAVADVKPACIPALVAASGQALANVKDAAEQSVSVTGSVTTN